MTPTRLYLDSCQICGTPGRPIGTKTSSFSGLEFHFCRCPECGFTYIADPRVDFPRLYDAEYYAGRGADRNVEYLQEMANPRTVREYEWRGLLRAVRSLVGERSVRWLDYGSGLGGLVRYLRARGIDAHGFDEGWSGDWMRGHGIPCLEPVERTAQAGSFDVVTAVEVLEHVPDPVGLLREVGSMLKAGGLFLLTTGNAAPHQRHFLEWTYVNPDVHVGYFEPRTLVRVYEAVGLRPESPGFLPGYDDIIRYKVLRAVGFHDRSRAEQLLPWGLMSRVVDRRHAVSAQPVAWRPG